MFLGCKHAVIRFKEQGDGGVILNTGSVAGLVGWGGSVYGATKGAVHQLTRAVAVEVAPFGIRVNAICPAGMPYTGFMAAGGMAALGRGPRRGRHPHRIDAPLGRPITAEDCAEAAVYLCSDGSANVTGILLPIDGGYVAQMTGTRATPRPRSGPPALRPGRQRPRLERRHTTATIPYPVWHDLREQAAVHEGTVHALSGIEEDILFHGLPYPDRPHFSAFSWAACDAAYRNPETFASSAEAVDLEEGEPGPDQQHAVDGRRPAPPLPGAGAAVLLAGQGPVVGRELDRVHGPRPHRLLRDAAAGPSSTSSSAPPSRSSRSRGASVFRSNGPSTSESHLSQPERIIEMLAPIVAARREQPEDDLISVLVEAEITDEDGDDPSAHRRRDLLVRPAPARCRLGHHLEADGHHAGRPAPTARAPRRRPGRSEPAAAR